MSADKKQDQDKHAESGKCKAEKGPAETDVQSENCNSSSTSRQQPEVLCNCPQKCGERVPTDVKKDLFSGFNKLGDNYRQNLYLQLYIEMRSVYKRLWCQEERIKGRLQRRVSCKYKIPRKVPHPLLPPNVDSVQRPPKLTTNSKGKMTFIIGSKCSVDTVEVCQKAFMNVYGITEKRIRLQREKLITRLRNDTTECMSSSGPIIKSLGDKTKPIPRKNTDHISVTNDGLQGSLEYDIAIVETFFQNQLWKPEYIGINSMTNNGNK